MGYRRFVSEVSQSIITEVQEVSSSAAIALNTAKTVQVYKMDESVVTATISGPGGQVQFSCDPLYINAFTSTNGILEWNFMAVIDDVSTTPYTMTFDLKVNGISVNQFSVQNPNMENAVFVNGKANLTDIGNNSKIWYLLKNSANSGWFSYSAFITATVTSGVLYSAFGDYIDPYSQMSATLWLSATLPNGQTCGASLKYLTLQQY